MLTLQLMGIFLLTFKCSSFRLVHATMPKHKRHRVVAEESEDEGSSTESRETSSDKDTAEHEMS